MVTDIDWDDAAKLVAILRKMGRRGFTRHAERALVRGMLNYDGQSWRGGRPSPEIERRIAYWTKKLQKGS